MERSELEALGRALAERHQRLPAEPQPELSLLNYAESPRVGDWTMRSALMRFAQPQAERAGNVLELVRRLDAVLHHVARPLERHTVTCDRALGLDLTDQPADPYPDARTADLARIAWAEPEGFAAVLAAYSRVSPLDSDEHAALPLLGVALLFDGLADRLAEWANDWSDRPPVDVVDETCTAVRARLDELGVPTEQRPPRRPG